MDCSRCSAEAVVKRGSAAYCAKCALARDWEDVIAVVQEERLEVAAPARKAAAKATAAVSKGAAESNGNSGSDDLPADPFA